MLKYQQRISPRIPAAINRYEFFLLRKLSIADVSFQMIMFKNYSTKFPFPVKI